MTATFAWQCGFLALIGLLAGFINVLAGGGSLLTLPTLIFLGLPAATANGTNRIAILSQNIFAASSFRRHGVLPLRLALLCTVPALAGSYFGANLAITIDEQLFQRLLAVIMIGVLVFNTLDPMKRWRCAELHLNRWRIAALLLCFFAIGVYGGFVQAGVGFLIISALLAQGLDLVRINAIKVFVVGIFTLVALAVFIQHQQVNFGLGLALAAGNSIGGTIATRMAINKGHDWIKNVVSLTILCFAIKLLLA
ncbi:integrase [Syntrophotalea acetylenivorans]|uniref:Probable membrane transporter protein n=1 Tax=Syntrophotalea acetylenivorans TaxID=1842532 RepID=A0A1L3GPV7_9BACT|nr:sulfite exporter TauE/SafE family protein [Syntrophotalea acetylenivorans]APG27954.1 integrase [Syntrophotalea acetylenivorans]